MSTSQDSVNTLPPEVEKTLRDIMIRSEFSTMVPDAAVDAILSIIEQEKEKARIDCMLKSGVWFDYYEETPKWFIRIDGDNNEHVWKEIISFAEKRLQQLTTKSSSNDTPHVS